MEILISGRPTKITKKETREILNWIDRELRVDRFKTPILINLKFIKNLKYKNGYRGSAIWDDDNHRPREFTIEVDSELSKSMSTKVLIHEMVHVRQYAEGKLKDLLRYFSLKRWGKRIINEDKIAYKQLPWEREAYRLEKKYYKIWRDYNKKCR